MQPRTDGIVAFRPARKVGQLDHKGAIHRNPPTFANGFGSPHAQALHLPAAGDVSSAPFAIPAPPPLLAPDPGGGGSGGPGLGGADAGRLSRTAYLIGAPPARRRNVQRSAAQIVPGLYSWFFLRRTALVMLCNK